MYPLHTYNLFDSTYLLLDNHLAEVYKLREAVYMYLLASDMAVLQLHSMYHQQWHKLLTFPAYTFAHWKVQKLKRQQARQQKLRLLRLNINDVLRCVCVFP